MSFLSSLFGGSRDRFHILVVCKANVTRSPYIEGLLRNRIQERFEEVADEIGVSSAGVDAVNGYGPDSVMRVLALDHGVNVNGHRSRPMSAKLARQADVILTLEEEFAERIQNRFRDAEGKTFALPKFGRVPDGPESGDVADPTGKEAMDYEAFVEQADEEVDRILEVLEGDLLDVKTNLVLIGMPGAGKSSIGKALSEKLDAPFLDTDESIAERAGTSLQEIVDTQGYERLRALEEDVLLDLEVSDTIIATGGSAVYSEEAMKHLRRNGRIVYLRVPYELMQERIGDGAGRGLARPADQSLHHLYEEREPLYRRWAEWTLPVDSRSVAQLATQLRTWWR